MNIDQRLIVYGSLVPGGSNHHELASLSGTWRSGWVTGSRFEVGWGAAIGYSALHPDPEGERVPAYLLESPDLPQHWSRLDEFEGEQYRRVPVPFEAEDGERVTGQLYAVAERDES